MGINELYIKLNHSSKNKMANRILPFIQQDIMLIEDIELTSSVYFYKKISPGHLYVSPSTKLYISIQSSMASFSKFFQPKAKSNSGKQTNFKYEKDVFSQELLNKNEQYQNYVKQNFFTAKDNSKTMSTIQICIDKIRAMQIVETQLTTKPGQPDAPRQIGLFFDFKTSDSKQMQIILQPQSFNVDQNQCKKNLEQIIENVKMRRLLHAAGSATLRSSIQTIKNLENDKVDFQQSHHFDALRLSTVPVKQFLKLLHGDEKGSELLCGEVTMDHLFWRRIGFQGTKPQSDFRAAGLLGVLAIVYTAFYSPDFLANASYPDQFTKAKDVENYFQQKGKTSYGYPIAISVITCAHSIISSDQIEKLATESTNLFEVLVNDYIDDYIYILNNSEVVTEQLQKIVDSDELYTITVMEMTQQNAKTEDLVLQKKQTVQQYIELLHKISQQMNDENCDVETIFSEIVQFNNNQLQFLPIQPLMLQNRLLASLNPQMCGCFLKLITLVCLELNRRLSSYDASTQYMNYAGQFQVVVEDLKQCLKQDDVLNVDDLLLRMKRTW